MKNPLLAALAMLSVAAVHGQTVSGLFDTGVNSSGSTLADLSTDTHWTATPIGGPAAFVNTTALTSDYGYPLNGAWLADDASSDWIVDWRAENVSGETLYQTTFTLSGDVSDFSLEGKWSADDGVDNYLVNNQSYGGGGSGFTGWTNFDLGPTAGWVDGVNTVSFIVRNDGGPTGFRVEFAQAPAPDAPMSAAIVAAVLGTMLVLRRRTAARG